MAYNHKEYQKQYQKTYMENHKNNRRLYMRSYMRQYKKADPAKVKLIKRRYGLKLKMHVLGYYGIGGKPVCVNCGFKNIYALSIDHIFNNGAEERKLVGGGEALYQSLKKRNFPTGYQTLCFNCQWIKELTRRLGPLI